ncbi:MAG: hypothetical protein LJE87_06430 [Deltaproteobacteria bacterium]|jgi:hypothetical protein|nr:hypothetical protein [Deltaproteobacteria bacterium]
MFRKVFFAIVLITVVVGCQKPPPFVEEHPGAKGQPPELLGYYAAKEINPGRTWNVYLKAKDVDGDMKYIVVVIFMAGEGDYTPSEIWLKGENRSEFDGYIFLNIPPDDSLATNMDSLTASIFIRDWEGNKSQTIKLPLSFEPKRVTQVVPAQWQQAAKNQLGYINNTIISPQEEEYQTIIRP